MGRRQLPGRRDSPPRAAPPSRPHAPQPRHTVQANTPTHHNPQQLEFVAPPARLFLAAVHTASSTACRAAATAAPCAVLGVILCPSSFLRTHSLACPLVLVLARAPGRQPHHTLPALRHLHAARHGTIPTLVHRQHTNSTQGPILRQRPARHMLRRPIRINGLLTCTTPSRRVSELGQA